MKKVKKISVAKYQGGGKLGALSVKAGVDKNPGITRADIITGAKKAQSGAKIDKTAVKKTKVNPNIPNAKQQKNQKDAQENKNMRPPFKSGGKMKKCKGGC